MQDSFALKHVSGSRANRVDRLVLSPEREIILGRDRECHVRYSEADELVSRKHLKIVAGGGPPIRYMAVDLGSRNGTFVNRQRVLGALVLSPGARVQLGAGGPEFEFQLDTEPEREQSPKPGRSATSAALRNRGAGLGRRVLLMSLPAALGAVRAAGYVSWPRVARFWEHSRHTPPAPRKDAFDPHAALASLVRIEAEWTVLHKETHSRLARAYITNERISGTEHVPLIEQAPKTLPAFVLEAGRRIEPLLRPRRERTCRPFRRWCLEREGCRRTAKSNRSDRGACPAALGRGLPVAGRGSRRCASDHRVGARQRSRSALRCPVSTLDTVRIRVASRRTPRRSPW